jgi:Rrf2 family protein
MTLITTRGSYGLLAMYELYINDHDAPIGVSKISQNTGISRSYLEQLLNKLKKANLVSSTRGVLGGYKLSRSPDKITIGEILISLDGDVSVANTTDNPIINMLYDDIKNDISKSLDVTLLSLDEYMQKHQNNINYTI